MNYDLQFFHYINFVLSHSTAIMFCCGPPPAVQHTSVYYMSGVPPLVRDGTTGAYKVFNRFLTVVEARDRIVGLHTGFRLDIPLGFVGKIVLTRNMVESGVMLHRDTIFPGEGMVKLYVTSTERNYVIPSDYHVADLFMMRNVSATCMEIECNRVQ